MHVVIREEDFRKESEARTERIEKRTNGKNTTTVRRLLCCLLKYIALVGCCFLRKRVDTGRLLLLEGVVCCSCRSLFFYV